MSTLSTTARVLGAALLLAACTDGPADTQPTDGDGDGWGADEDCDDANDAVYPDAEEVCDGLDNDCDDAIDEEASDARTFYADVDGDGYGDEESPVVACEQPEDTAIQAGDCDDGLDEVNPEGQEICNDLDDDCNGTIDDDASDALSFYADDDEDGYGDPDDITQACSVPEGYVDNDFDCDDADAERNPDTAWYLDGDGDGYGDAGGMVRSCVGPADYVRDDTDCDDSRARVNPGADEVCDRLDNDCDDVVDTEDGACDRWAGRYGTTYRIQAQEKVGSTVLNDMVCDGSASFFIEYTADPPVQGTLTCAHARYPGFYSTQTATFEGEVYPDGTVVGSLTHEFNDHATRTYEVEGSADPSITLEGEGTVKPNSMSAVPWEVTIRVPGP